MNMTLILKVFFSLLSFLNDLSYRCQIGPKLKLIKFSLIRFRFRSSHLEMRAIQKKLSKSKSCPKCFSCKCSIYFKLMLWLEYLTKTHEIFIQKTGAHVLFESFFKIIFALSEAECHRFLITMAKKKLTQFLIIDCFKLKC